MVFDYVTQTLFVFGGQRDEKYLSDMYAYHIPTNTITELYHNFTTAGGPDACFTQRAVIDPHLREIYLYVHWPLSSFELLSDSIVVQVLWAYPSSV